jgi:hypothetical protein
LLALDARGQILPAGKIGMPLRRAVHTVRAGQLLDENSWAQLQKLVQFLTNEKLSACSFEQQERARVLLARWREDISAQLELAQARISQLRRTLHQEVVQWPQSEKVVSQIAALIRKFEGEETLGRAANLDTNAVQPIVGSWRDLLQKLEARHAAVLSGFALLSHPDLSTPAELQNGRAEILAHFQNGEAILDDENLLRNLANWREAYARSYQNWHATQNDAARWNSLRRLLHSDELRALDRLSTLQSRPFPHAQNIRRELGIELQKQCPRDGLLLPGEATCNACRLRLGARLLIRDAREIEAQITAAIAAFVQALQETAPREYLVRHAAARELLEWNSGSALLPVLNDEVLTLLDEAFKPRRVARSLDELNASLKSCRTRDEFESTFKSWIDGGENLASDDEIELG